MAKTKTTPRGAGMKPVTTAAKWPDKTEKFLDDIDGALSNFDDEISSVDSKTREAAYETFVKTYQTAFTAIWPKFLMPTSKHSCSLSKTPASKNFAE